MPGGTSAFGRLGGEVGKIKKKRFGKPRQGQGFEGGSLKKVNSQQRVKKGVDRRGVYGDTRGKGLGAFRKKKYAGLKGSREAAGLPINRWGEKEPGHVMHSRKGHCWERRWGQ